MSHVSRWLFLACVAWRSAAEDHTCLLQEVSIVHSGDSRRGVRLAHHSPLGTDNVKDFSESVSGWVPTEVDGVEPEKVEPDSVEVTPIDEATANISEAVPVNYTVEFKNATENKSVTATHENITMKIGDGTDGEEVEETDTIVVTTNQTDKSSNATPEVNEEAVEEIKKPFVKKTVNVSVNVSESSEVIDSTHKIVKTKRVVTTRVNLKVASSSDILFTYLALFTPLLIMWSFYACTDGPEMIRPVPLAITMCMMIVAWDLVSQSLVEVTGSPFGNTTVQMMFMTVSSVLILPFDRNAIKDAEPYQYGPWLICSLVFGTLQQLNHLVSSECSLSERTVANNLCPVLTIIFESLLMPRRLRPEMNWRTKCSLCALLVGAVLFAWQSLDLSPSGVSSALLMVVGNVPYRLLQRRYLGTGNLKSLWLLMVLDGLLGTIVSLCVVTIAQPNFASFWADVSFWVNHGSVMFMLTLSCFAFAAQHLFSLKILNVSSATSYTVFASLAGFLEVIFGVWFFLDDIDQSALQLFGLLLSLYAGLWYSIEVFYRDLASTERLADNENTLQRFYSTPPLSIRATRTISDRSDKGEPQSPPPSARSI